MQFSKTYRWKYGWIQRNTDGEPWALAPVLQSQTQKTRGKDSPTMSFWMCCSLMGEQHLAGPQSYSLKSIFYCVLPSCLASLAWKISGVTRTFANFTISFSFISHSFQDRSAAVMALNHITDEHPLLYSKPRGKQELLGYSRQKKDYFTL